MDMKLDHFPDLQRGKEARVEIDLELTDAGKLNKYLVGHFLDGQMAYPLIVSTARNQWKEHFVSSITLLSVHTASTNRWAACQSVPLIPKSEGVLEFCFSARCCGVGWSLFQSARLDLGNGYSAKINPKPKICHGFRVASFISGEVVLLML